jgi:addiction module HigA family antidote
MKMHNPPHPGAVLFDTKGDITVSQLAAHLGIERANMSRILHGRMSITPAIALKLSEAFPSSQPEFWLALQAQYDIAKERKKKRTKVKPLQSIAA